MGGILTMPQFLEYYPSINTEDEMLKDNPALSQQRANEQGIAVASYNLGCFVGAVITVFISNALGRKRMIILGTSIMV